MRLEMARCDFAGGYEPTGLCHLLTLGFSLCILMLSNMEYYVLLNYTWV